jgi:hypothetical protein
LNTEYDASMEIGEDINVEPVDGMPTESDVGQPVEQPNILDLEQFSDYHVQVGEETLSVRELRESGLRQADYTRKTQELAERGRELDRASTLDKMLEANPRGTLEYLARQNGLSLADNQQEEPPERNWFDDDTSQQSVDPMASRIAAIEDRFQREDTDAEYRRAFEGLKSKFGDEFNIQEVAKAAYERGIYDPNHLEMVFNDLAVRKMRAAGSNARSAAASKQASQNASRQAAAASANAISGGGSSAAGTASIPTSTRPMTTREAIELAWDASQ